MMSGMLGFVAALALCAAVNMLPMPARFQGMTLTWQAGATAVAVLTLIGVATSTYPARRAALLPPVEALRFEQ
jgi:ABC-type lipoprotein release transport system permease subunit